MVWYIILYIVIGVIVILISEFTEVTDIAYEEYGWWGLAVILWPIIFVISLLMLLGFLVHKLRFFISGLYYKSSYYNNKKAR